MKRVLVQGDKTTITRLFSDLGNPSFTGHLIDLQKLEEMLLAIFPSGNPACSSVPETEPASPFDDELWARRFPPFLMAILLQPDMRTVHRRRKEGQGGSAAPNSLLLVDERLIENEIYRNRLSDFLPRRQVLSVGGLPDHETEADDTEGESWFVFTRGGAILDVSPDGAKFLGYDPGELTGTCVWDLVIESENRTAVLLHLSNYGRVDEHYCHLKSKNGRLKTVFLTARMIEAEAGGEEKVFCSVSDCTQPWRMAEELVKSREKYHMLFEFSQDMIFMCSPEGVMEDLNPAGVQLLGYDSKSALLSTRLVKGDVLIPSNQQEYLRQLREQGYVKDFEMDLVRRDREHRTVLESSSVVHDAEGKIVAYIGIVRDVSERMRRERLLQMVNEELLLANRQIKETQSRLIHQEKLASIGQLAAGVAHELNNPVGFILSNFNTLRSYVKTVKDYVQCCEQLVVETVDSASDSDRENSHRLGELRKTMKLEEILADMEDIFAESKEGLDQITSIVRNLRGFSRIDSSDHTPYDLNAGLESTLVVARNELKYVADIKKELGDIPVIRGSGNELNQVLLNILVNAAQAIGSQNRPGKGLISIRTYMVGDRVCCEIRDDGPGISAAVIKRIFDPFFTTKEAGKGTGLGLHISYDIVVNKYGGDIWVESEPGEGTCFFIRLPIGRTEGTRPEAPIIPNGQ